MSIAHELSDLLNRPNGPSHVPTGGATNKLMNGLIAGVFFSVAILVGSGDAWLAANFGLGMFLVIGDILRFHDRSLGITAGFLAGLCASGVIGSFFGPEIGKVTALGILAAVAPAIHIMDTEPGWGRAGRNVLGVCWSIAMTGVFLLWFFENYSLRMMG